MNDVAELNWPLMQNNIPKSDLEVVCDFLHTDPILTHGEQVRAFEAEWSQWLGVKHSVMVNSGASANLLTMTALREVFGPGEVIVPTLTWVSDIASVMQCGLKPVFVDINPRTLGMDEEQVLMKLTLSTRAVFMTHVLGYNALSERLIAELKQRKVALIEDVCELHGATFNGQKLGTFGLMSNFSFYYAHHMSTIEGGVICTDDDNLYELLRMLRSHGMTRESRNAELKASYVERFPDLNPDFIFAFAGFNVRPTEINAVIGREQLKRLDANNDKRKRNLQIFLDNLDSQKYFTEFDTKGSCNYAFTLVLNQPDDTLCDNVMRALKAHRVEFRRGTAGGGNQLRQPYLLKKLGPQPLALYPRVDHIHFYGFYIGNYPDLEADKILALCHLLNSLEGDSKAFKEAA